MISLRRALTTVGVLTIANGVNAILAFGVSVFAARTLPTDEFGRVAVLMTTSVFLGVILDVGVNQIVTRRVAVRPESRIVHDVHRVRLVLALATTAISLVVLVLAGWEERSLSSDACAWALLVTASVWQLVFSTEQAYTQGAQRFGTLAFQIVAIAAIRLVLVGTASVRPSFQVMLIAYTAPAVVVGIVSSLRLQRLLTSTFQWRLLRSLFPVVGLAGVAVCLTALLGRMSLWMVSWLAGRSAAGTYAVAFQAASLVLALGSAVTLCLLPHVAQVDRDRRAHAFLVAYLRRGGPVAAFLMAGAGVFAYLVPHLFGRRYAGTEVVTLLLMISFVLSLLNSPFYALQQSRFRYPFLIVVHTTQAAVLFVGCWSLVPRWGVTGAASSELLARVVGVAWVTGDALLQARRANASGAQAAAGVMPTGETL